MIIMTRLSAKIARNVEALAQVAVPMALGIMAGVGITDAWSAHQRHVCKGQERTHSVVSLPTFWGHTSSCVDRRML
jgi:hypothetical protein